MTSSAQQVVQPDEVSGPVGRVHFDLATGKMTKVVYPREVRRLKQVLGERWIVSPSHEALLPNVSLENATAMRDAAAE